MPELIEHGVELVKKFEKCKLTAYEDSGGILTIGYGHTSDKNLKVTEGLTITQAKADELLWLDLGEAETLVKKVKYNLLNDYQYSALVSLAYNSGVIGEPIKELINEGRLSDAGNALLKYRVTAGGKQLSGLRNRRRAEWCLYFLNENSQITAKDWVENTMNDIYVKLKYA